jgi:integrase
LTYLPIFLALVALLRFSPKTKKDELGILWQYASHFERRLLLLALNCGASISEIGNLDWKEVEGEHIKGLRPKTKVYGEFKLWEMTKKALGEPKKKAPYEFELRQT